MSLAENGIKQFQDMTLIEQLRNNLQPQGTADIVLLKPRHSSGIELSADFVNKCITELERIPLLASLGQPPSNLERLAYMLLCDSAYIEQNVRQCVH
jgi:hypothetical protein